MNGIICTILGIYTFILFVRVLLSWFPRLPDGVRPIAHVVYVLTEPLVRFARPLVPPLRIGAVALDLSIILIFVLLGIIRRVVCQAGL